MRVWRIAAAKHPALDGEGSRRYGGRWTPRGFAVVYASATLSLAALERLVHADPDLQPQNLVAVPIDVPRGVKVESIAPDGLPGDWRDYPAPAALAARGEQWLREARTAVLSVPSAVIPAERNFLLNPAHADFRRCQAGPAQPFSFDPRLWPRRRARE